MATVFNFLVPISLIAVIGALFFGMFALFRGGDFGRTWSNKAMRMRVLLQFIAVLVLAGALLAKRYFDPS